MHEHEPGHHTNAHARAHAHIHTHTHAKTDSVHTALLRSAEPGHAPVQRAIDQILSIFDDL